MLQKLCAKILYGCLGWRLEGELPRDHSRILLVFLPHTSNWDLVIGSLFIAAEKLSITIFAKDSFYVFPFKYVYRYFNIIPVKRNVRSNFVDQAAALYDDGAELWTAMAPEGTRSYKSDLRSGYYYFARKAGIKVVAVGPDFASKTMHIRPPREVLASFEEDSADLIKFSSQCRGKRPEQGI